MPNSILSTLDDRYTVIQQNQDHRSPYCTLQWRQGQLLVRPLGQVKQPYLPSLDHKQHLVECLKYSSIKLVRIDPKLGEAKLRFWADACKQASKPIYLRIPTNEKVPQSKVLLKRLIDISVALMLLLIISPVMFGLQLLMRFYSPGPIFEQEWHIGERGRLFKVLKFRTTVANDKTQIDSTRSYKSNAGDREDEHQFTSLGRFMLRYGLHNLPLLLNVVRGEMSLIGPRYWTLAEAVRLNLEAQRQLNKLPGITGLWQEGTETKLLQLDSQIM
ncbi:heterocyst development glycosyltransferase HepC [Chlorogloeopsis sp. ULAP02]|uniref:heterocyst development glycosyltransferase HepC n=1 Tax=Chlorogloeopsis sp. ULAP02 TaxID=3107926 RepID=UPI003134CAAE